MWTCSYAIFYSETNELSKHWAKQCKLPWSATYSHESKEFHFDIIKKIMLSQAQFYKAKKKNYSQTKSILQEWLHFLKQASHWPEGQQNKETATYLGTSCATVCACQPNSPMPQTILCLSAAPRALPLIFKSKLSIAFWNSHFERWLNDRQGL